MTQGGDEVGRGLLILFCYDIHNFMNTIANIWEHSRMSGAHATRTVERRRSAAKLRSCGDVHPVSMLAYVVILVWLILTVLLDRLDNSVPTFVFVVCSATR